MKFAYLVLGAISFASAFVIPDEEALASIAIGHGKDELRPCPSRDATQKPIKDAAISFPSAVNDAIDSASFSHDTPLKTSTLEKYFNPTAPKTKPKDQWPPRRGTPCFLTVYEELVRSRHTTKLAKLINQDKTLVGILNNNTLDHTVFAPSDRAFDAFPGNLSAWSKYDMRALVLYHVAPGLFPVEKLIESSTVPTLLNQSSLDLDALSQRLTVRVEEEDLVVGYEGRIAAADIPATNGYMHIIDTILTPPEPTTRILSSLPTEFSTLTLALHKTGLYKNLSTPATSGFPTESSHHNGTTLFAPPNTAFLALPPSIPTFLFSSPVGAKYLRALLKYHVVVNHTLFSDVLYNDKGEVLEFGGGEREASFVLPTMLGNCSVAVDVGRARGGEEGGDGVREIRVNGAEVAFVDSVARFGVLHVVDQVLVPGPRGDGEELTVEELMDRLRPWVEEDDEVEEDVWDMDHLEL